MEPICILICSGKRKSGKDYLSDYLLNEIGSNHCAIVRLSGPLKSQYAKDHGLSYEKLLDSSSYKETFRQDMIIWGEKKRNEDPSFFCRHAIKNIDKCVWIVSDARRHSDLHFFFKNYSKITKTVRVIASEEARQNRGWTFTKGVDDKESECNLDDVKNWDFVIENSNTTEFKSSVQILLDYVQTLLNIT